MGKIITSFCIISLLGLPDIQAQNDNLIWKYDPTYSVHNYKHPNKAAAAKQLQTDPATHYTTIIEPVSRQTDTKVLIPNRKVMVIEKTAHGKIKTPLAIRRKASEKFNKNIIYPDNNQHIDD